MNQKKRKQVAAALTKAADILEGNPSSPWADPNRDSYRVLSDIHYRYAKLAKDMAEDAKNLERYAGYEPDPEASRLMKALAKEMRKRAQLALTQTSYEARRTYDYRY